MTFFTQNIHVLILRYATLFVLLYNPYRVKYLRSAHTHTHSDTRIYLTQPYARGVDNKHNTRRCHYDEILVRESNRGDTRRDPAVSEREQDFCMIARGLDRFSFLLAFFLPSNPLRMNYTLTPLHLGSSFHFISFCFPNSYIMHSQDRQWPFLWGFSFSLECWLNF